jgi:hypothetical protein
MQVNALQILSIGDWVQIFIPRTLVEPFRRGHAFNWPSSFSSKMTRAKRTLPYKQVEIVAKPTRRGTRYAAIVQDLPKEDEHFIPASNKITKPNVTKRSLSPVYVNQNETFSYNSPIKRIRTSAKVSQIQIEVLP